MWRSWANNRRIFFYLQKFFGTHMERLDLSQAELARQAGIQPTHLSAVLQGHRQLSLTQIKKLSAFFAIPADALIDNPFRNNSEHRPSAG